MQLRFGEQNLHTNSAPQAGAGRLSGARFAPPSPLTLAAPSRGAKSSHRFRAAARGRPLFPRRGLLPANLEPLRLRFGEQNLHTIPAPPPETGRLFQGAVCSPLSASPCGSVPGSKFFTQIPRRKPGAARLFQGAVCSPLLANPCGSVLGSKFFTQIPRRRTKNTLPVYRQGASLSSTVPPQVPVPRGTFN